MFNPISEIKIDEKWKKAYFMARFFLLIVFLLIVFLAAYRFLFPSFVFDFSLQNLSEQSKSSFFTRKSNGTIPVKGKVASGEKLLFDIFLSQSFSDVEVTFVLSKNSTLPLNDQVGVRKTYKAFTYPTANKPAGFYPGSLLSVGEDFYFAGMENLQKVSGVDALSALGYKSEQFISVSIKSITQSGMEIKSLANGIYPEMANFLIDGKFYQLHSGILREYASEKVFFHENRANSFVEKERSFLNRYRLGEEPINFSSGTLLSFGDAVYMVVGENLLNPFDNQTTFLSLGLSWDDVVAASEEEVHFYKKGGLFSMDNPHPSGVIFQTIEKGEYFLVNDEKIFKIPNTDILNSYPFKKSIFVEEQALETLKDCRLENKAIFSRSLSCVIDVSALDVFAGNAFQFSFSNQKDVDINTVRVKFFSKVNWENLDVAIVNAKNKLKINYGLEKNN